MENKKLHLTKKNTENCVVHKRKTIVYNIGSLLVMILSHL